MGDKSPRNKEKKKAKIQTAKKLATPAPAATAAPAKK
jgi:hypothetical protein